MKNFWKSPVLAVLTSTKLAAILMALAAFAMGYATIFETTYGREGAYARVYAAPWFEALLGLITLNLLLLFFKRWPYKARDLGFMFVHLSIVVILISSGITRYFGYEGSMPIREGQTVSHIYSMQSHVQVHIGDDAASYPVRLYRSGANDIRQTVTINDQDYELGISEYWAHFTQTYQAAPGGQPGLKYGTPRHGDIETEFLLEGEKATLGSVEVHYLTGGFVSEMSLSPRGDLRVRAGGESGRLAIGGTGDDVLDCGGYRFEITEFQTDFKVGGTPNTDGPMTNPMIRVAITGPDGTQGQRMLFALHPEFSMGHASGGDDFPDLNLLYSINSGVELAAGGQTGLQGRASFELTLMDIASEESTTLKAGDVFDVQPEKVYTDGGDFTLVPVEILPSVILAPTESTDSHARAAARVHIRDESGNEAEAICLKKSAPQRVMLGDKSIQLAYGPIRQELPYSLYLEDFVLQTYPGSSNPATYESYVRLTDTAAGITDQRHHVYMNHPLNYAGSKHFQSSYDQDHKGTILTVNHDPGKWPTYLGYALITLGFILAIIRDFVWPRSEDKTKSRATRAAAFWVGVLALGAGGQAMAQADHAGSQATAAPPPNSTGFVELSESAREAASNLIVQDYRGRMKPLDTLAREVLMKVAKKTKLEGRQPVDMYLNWMANPQYWWEQPILRVRFGGIRDLLDVPAEAKRIAPSSLIDDQGQYRLQAQLEAAHRTPDRDRTKLQRKLITFDEQFQILLMVLRGTTLRLYPIPDDPNNTWQDIDNVTRGLAGEQATEFESAYSNLIGGLRDKDSSRIKAGLDETHMLQLKYGAAVIPSQNRVKAELLYNSSHVFSWMMVPLLGSFGILMVLYIWNLFRRDGGRISYRNPFYSLGMAIYVLAFVGMIAGYVLRWVASGRAPLSNGHESLLFISLTVVLAGLLFELYSRFAVSAALASLLTLVVLGVSMLSMFDPAIGPLVPVLVSYWLNIHVTIITASYGFLGLSALIGLLVLVQLLFKGPGKDNLRIAIEKLDRINHRVVVVGLGLLTIGTLLGGVWANESWGRYWGWDAKETWSLVTILVYSVVLHFRYIKPLKSTWINASGSLLAISSVVMTYFGVNYFLSGLHSYASGDVAQVPAWVYMFSAAFLTLVAVSGVIDRSSTWERKK